MPEPSRCSICGAEFVLDRRARVVAGLRECDLCAELFDSVDEELAE